MHKILICGDRNWTDESLISMALTAYIPLAGKDAVVIHGDARGADKLGARAATKLGLKVIAFPADWGTFKRGAGPIRNQIMIEQEPSIILAFHDHIRMSHGTVDMLVRARKNGTPYNLYSHFEDTVRWRPQSSLLA